MGQLLKRHWAMWKLILRLQELFKENNIFKFPQQYQASDHVLEVQIPFLQYILDPDFKIVPIVIGTKSKYALNKITELLKPYFTEENLFVISTAFLIIQLIPMLLRLIMPSCNQF